MSDLNYRHLRYFWAVARDGNLTRTAERLNLSQSALSVQIRKLEERLGHALFERYGRQLHLTEAGRIALLHALAHIELNAIDLSWDIVARFAGWSEAGRRLPKAFFDDWVGVADDEARHHAMLEARLNRLGASYGDLPAHDGLWQASMATAHDLAARLALVPLVLEARGLDVTPAMIESLRRHGDDDSADALQIIHDDEIGHVAAGKRWFDFVCAARRLEPVTVTTQPHPGFPTDLQPCIAALSTITSGKSFIRERIFENRYDFVDGLLEMGADILISQNDVCIVNGVEQLTGANVRAASIRAGAALLLASLAAEGTTYIDNVYQIDRGHERIEEQLQQLGASVTRVQRQPDEDAVPEVVV